MSNAINFSTVLCRKEKVHLPGLSTTQWTKAQTHTNTHCTDEPHEPRGVYSGWQNLRRSVGFSLKEDLKNHALILGAKRYKLRPMESSMVWVW